MEISREFKGIWIAKEVWLNAELSLLEKIMLAEIDSLDGEDGCFATNEYFANFFGLSIRQVSRLINDLAEKKLIVSTIDKSKGNRRTIRTLLPKLSIAIDKNVHTPIDKNVLSYKEDNKVRESKVENARPPRVPHNEYMIALQKKWFRLNVFTCYENYCDWCRRNNKTPKRQTFEKWLEREEPPMPMQLPKEKTSDLKTPDEIEQQRTAALASNEFRKPPTVQRL